jgi:hypothetical protein
MAPAARHNFSERRGTSIRGRMSCCGEEEIRPRISRRFPPSAEELGAENLAKKGTTPASQEIVRRMAAEIAAEFATRNTSASHGASRCGACGKERRSSCRICTRTMKPIMTASRLHVGTGLWPRSPHLSLRHLPCLACLVRKSIGSFPPKRSARSSQAEARLFWSSQCSPIWDRFRRPHSVRRKVTLDESQQIEKGSSSDATYALGRRRGRTPPIVHQDRSTRHRGR